MKKSIIPIVMALTTVIILIVLSLAIAPNRDPMLSYPPDFTRTSVQVSLDELLNVVDNQNFSLYLPSKLPKDLELTNIYLKVKPFIAIVVYSAEGIKDYREAEFGIGIERIGTDFTPSYEELQSQFDKTEDVTVLKINDWPAIVRENVHLRSEKYGDYASIVEVYIEGNLYTLAGPNLSSDDLISIGQSMRVISA
ncbi:MAG: hypothetical protein ACFFFH_13920 [Candidatus Thorarchaeota archaeon]